VTCGGGGDKKGKQTITHQQKYQQKNNNNNNNAKNTCIRFLTTFHSLGRAAECQVPLLGISSRPLSVHAKADKMGSDEGGDEYPCRPPAISQACIKYFMRPIYSQPRTHHRTTASAAHAACLGSEASSDPAWGK